jgi:MATE family multidrug resistance protein
LAHLFSANAEVAMAASAVLAWVALYHLVDALQAVSAFILRCYRITLLPLAIYSVMLWGVGLGGAYLWAYEGLGSWPARPEVSTFWASSSMALSIVTLFFLVLVLWVAKPRRL